MARKRFHLSKRVAEQHPELEKELNALVSIVDALAPLPQDEQARVLLLCIQKHCPDSFTEAQKLHLLRLGRGMAT